MRKVFCLASWFLFCLPVIAQNTQQDKNKQVARGFFEQVLDKGRLELYAESHAKDFVAHAGDRDATLEDDIAAAKEDSRGRRSRRGLLDGIRYQHSGRNGLSGYWEKTPGRWHDHVSFQSWKDF
jgi:hypothetical protein